MPPVAIRRHPFAPLAEFLQSGATGGVALILSAIVALVWANSGAGYLYRAGLQAQLGPLPVHIWINDGLMALFFLLVGLELRREMVQGELASLRKVAAPAMAALGGMAVPALIFVALNWGTPGNLRGWAVSVATDIAFALAVLRILGRRIPAALVVFLTALAIMDDLGAIAVIAVFYTRGLALMDLAGAGLVLAALYGLNRAGVRAIWPYLAGGVVLWVLVYKSGVHATLAGVALAFVVPQARKEDMPQARQEDVPQAGTDDVAQPGTAAVAERLEHRLEPWVACAILPLFGLTNAGLQLNDLPAGALLDPLSIGVVLGLFVGKQLGVFGAVMLAIRLGWAHRPSGVSTAQLYGGAMLCGIGFTMSLFINELAFHGSAQGEIVKLAVFVGSLASAAGGLAVLAIVSRQPQQELPLVEDRTA